MEIPPSVDVFPTGKGGISIAMLVYQRVIRMPQALVHSWKRIYNALFHQNLNGTESQRTPFSKLRARAIRYSGFFGVRGPWVLLGISWIFSMPLLTFSLHGIHSYRYFLGDFGGRSRVTPIYHPCIVYIYLHENHKDQPNVGKYTIHGWYGL